MYTHLSLSHRITIGDRLRQNIPQRQIAKEVGVSVSTISREVKRSRLSSYDPEVAHYRAEVRRRCASERPRKITEAVWREFSSLMKGFYSVSSAAVFLPVGKSALYKRLWKDGCQGTHMKPPRPRKKRLRAPPHCRMSFGIGYYRKRPKDGRFAMMKDAIPIAARPADCGKPRASRRLGGGYDVLAKTRDVAVVARAQKLTAALRRAEHILNHRPTPSLQMRTPAQQLRIC